MKKILYISLIALSQFLAGCDGFLVEDPTTSLDQNTAYTSAESANAVLNGCYSTLVQYDYFAYSYFHVMSVTSGSWVSTRTNEIPFTSMQIETNQVRVEKMYSAEYNTISVANDIIWNLPKSNIATEDKNKILGQAYIIRAMTYFNLVRQFGKVCLITKPVVGFEETQYPREEVAVVYDTIVSDLNKAYTMLPEPGSNVKGRPHKYAAKALLAKVYLTMAGNDDNSPYWQNAYDEAKVVYTSKAYTLVRPFSSVFSSANKNNNESILEFQFAAAIQPLRLTEITLPKGTDVLPLQSSELKQMGKTRPTKDTYDLFVHTYPGDPRIDATFLHDTYYNINAKKAINIYPKTTKTAGGNADDIEYAFLKKYIDPTFTTLSSANFIYYRYADLLLVLAEAANEINLKDEAIGYVNELLGRARDKDGDNIADADELSPAAWALTFTKEEVRSKILTERQIELSGEVDEWYTFRRRGEAYLKSIVDRHNTRLTKLTGYPTLAKFVYSFPATDNDIKRNMLLPFPLSEINSNTNISQADQNYGY